MSGTRSEFLAVARGEVGNKEYPPGSNMTRYGAWMGLNGQPWCMSFIQWCAHEAGVALPVRTGSCGALMRASQREGSWVTGDYQAGDIVMATYFSDEVKKYGSVSAALQAKGYTKNESGAWTKSSSGSSGSSGSSSGSGSSKSSSGSSNTISSTRTHNSSKTSGGTSGSSSAAAASSGYYDASKDYSAEIEKAKATGASAETIAQLQQERENKIASVYGGKEPTMYSSNQTYSQLTASGSGGSQRAVDNAIISQVGNSLYQRHWPFEPAVPAKHDPHHGVYSAFYHQRL